MTVEDFMTLPSVKEKSANKIFHSIHQILDNCIPLERVMAASLVFGNGFGEKKLAIITKEYPNILERKITIYDIINLDGFSEKTASVFIKNLPEFLKFLKKNPYFKFGEKNHTKGNMSNEIVVFSGFRDKELEKKIQSRGGEIGNTITSKTTLLIVKDDKETTKTKKAKELNIKIIDLKNFI
jgi:NAD-dependent DNA ligase